jgi:hypothetical protein
MSSSSAAASEADEITFPPTTAASVEGTVTSFTATEGDSESDAQTDCDSKSNNDMGHDGSSHSGGNNNNNNNNDDNNTEGQGYRRTHGTCEYYPSVSNSSHCQVQRSCYDCLNFNISTEANGCMVNTMGICSRLDYYNPALDYRLGHAANNETGGSSSYWNGSSSGEDGGPTVENEQYEFLASDASYCEQDDSQCLACIADQFAAVIYNNSGTSRSKFCYGQNGCVCVAVCEARRLNPPHMDQSCFANTMSANEPDKGTDYGSVFVITGAMVMVVIVVFAIYRIRKRGESDSSDVDDNLANNANVGRRPSDDDRKHLVITPDHDASPIAMAVAVPTLMPEPERRSSSSSLGKGSILLNLFNWHAIREVLVQREQMRLEGIDASTLPADTTGVDADGEMTKGDVQLVDVKPSAPEVDDKLPTAPAIPVVTVPSAPVVWTVRAMAGPGSPSAPSAPDFDDLDYDDDEQAMTAL